MKFIFSLYLSEDGISPYVFSNVKALFNYLSTLDGYKVLSIQDYRNAGEVPDITFTYANLLKVIRDGQQSNRFVMCGITCEDGEITIYENKVISK